MANAGPMRSCQAGSTAGAVARSGALRTQRDPAWFHIGGGGGGGGDILGGGGAGTLGAGWALAAYLLLTLGYPGVKFVTDVLIG